MSGVYPYNLISQAVSGLTVGTEYEFAFDIKVSITNVAITESCSAFLYHDTLSSGNVIKQNARTYNLNNVNWETLTGKWTATSTNTVFGIYVTCSPYRIPQINIFLDNAILRGKSY